jgi:hypothetical protein
MNKYIALDFGRPMFESSFIARKIPKLFAFKSKFNFRLDTIYDILQYQRKLFIQQTLVSNHHTRHAGNLKKKSTENIQSRTWNYAIKA